MLSKNVSNKKCVPELVFFNEKIMRKIPMIFVIETTIITITTQIATCK
jgi:hypothetical protein